MSFDILPDTMRVPLSWLQEYGYGGPGIGSHIARTRGQSEGTSTPVGAPDASLPSRFLACVSREESVQKLMRTFHGKGGLSENIEIVAGENLASVQEADVVLLW